MTNKIVVVVVVLTIVVVVVSVCHRVSVVVGGETTSGSTNTRNVPRRRRSRRRRRIEKQYEYPPQYQEENKNNKNSNNHHHSNKDRIYHLPGWDEQPLPSPWYSGYITFEFMNRTLHTHYILVLAEEENHENNHENENEDNENDNEKNHDNTTTTTPTTTKTRSNMNIIIKKKKKKNPLLYWSNGGPGSSSMFGLFTEIGPLILNDNSLLTETYRRTGIPTLIYNPYTYTKLGNVLIFDQPPPIGYSYCTSTTTTNTSTSTTTTTTTTATTNNNSQYEYYDDNNNNKDNDIDSHSCLGIQWTDELTSLSTYHALLAFMDMYPQQFKSTSTSSSSDNDDDDDEKVDLYLIGESYAGVYIPTLAERILFDDDDSNSNSLASQLRGIAIGDGCMGITTGICNALFDSNYVDLYGIFFLAGHHQIPLNTYKQVLLACNHKNNNHNHNHNNIHCQQAIEKVQKQVGGYYEYSLYDDCTYRNGVMNVNNNKNTMNHLYSNNSNINNNDYICGGYLVMEEYLSLDIVKNAFHIPTWKNFFSVDNAQGDFDYIITEQDVSRIFQYIHNQYNNNNNNNIHHYHHPNTTIHNNNKNNNNNNNNTNTKKKNVIKTLIYNGDTDPAITSFAMQNWTQHLGFNSIKNNNNYHHHKKNQNHHHHNDQNDQNHNVDTTVINNNNNNKEQQEERGGSNHDDDDKNRTISSSSSPMQRTIYWKPWTIDHCKRMGGYYTRYSSSTTTTSSSSSSSNENQQHEQQQHQQEEDDNRFDFVTIRGAGHLVPTYKPEATFRMMYSWINDDEYPIYDMNCTKPTIHHSPPTTDHPPRPYIHTDNDE